MLLQRVFDLGREFAATAPFIISLGKLALLWAIVVPHHQVPWCAMANTNSVDVNQRSVVT